MDILTVLMIVGFSFVGILVLAICLAWHAGSGSPKAIPAMVVPGAITGSPHKVSRKMVKLVCAGYFLMHTVTNKARPFNNRAYLKKYKSAIQNPLVVSHIKKVKGELEYE